MDQHEFQEWARIVADWSADYRRRVSELPVRSPSQPGDLTNQLPKSAPELPESMAQIFEEFQRLIIPGITHWQHPRFFAYFPSNAAPASVLAEMLTSSLAAQCMIWQTSPAATELETVMLRWLADALGLPGDFEGVIQDTASTASLVALLVMRERALNWQGNAKGLSGLPRLRIYASDLVHSSIDRAAWMAGIGQENLVRIPTRGIRHSMNPAELTQAILRDQKAGYLPCGVVLCVGGTSFGAVDELEPLIDIAHRYNLFVHVDAAWAGTAMLCPEYRDVWQGIEKADSLVVNPHKWLGIQFDCSTHFFRDADLILKTLAIHPEYLTTPDRGEARDYCEYSIQLGRRFRALKIWFVLRAYGLESLRERMRNHVRWSQRLAQRLESAPGFQIVTPPFLSLFTFRIVAQGYDAQQLDELNLKLLKNLNARGRIYLSPTKIAGQQVIRFQVGQFDCQASDIDLAYEEITQQAQELLAGLGTGSLDS